MLVLKNHTKCACCGESMESGEQFIWKETQVAYGSKVGSYQTGYRPAHIDRYCGAKKFAVERVRSEIAGLERTIGVITTMSGCEPALDVLRVRIDQEKAKLADIASW